MSEFFIGQIMMTGFPFAPKYFAQCNGQLLPISQNQALFSLLGTQYGGNGVNNFALPDLRSRTPVGGFPSADPAWRPPATVMGQQGGVENVTLLPGNMPAHTHGITGSNAAADTRNPRNGPFGSAGINLFAEPGPQVALNGQTMAASGGGQPHPNLQPYSAINFCIALNGIFPSRS